jgi:hypothetical protein
MFTPVTQTSSYTCGMYRQEMQLLALKRRRNDEAMSNAERRELEAQIETLVREMGFD